MFCPYCGNSCADAHKFCYRCGKSLPELNEQSPVPKVPEPQDSIPEESPTVTALPETDAAINALPEQLPEEQIPADEPAEPVAAEAPATSPAEPAPQQKKGRLWPPILALCIMISVGLATFFLAPKATEPVKSCFTVESGILYFDPSLYNGSDELTVPATVDGMTVTGISQGCFADCDSLTTIILPETVTIIGDNAFRGCDALRGIYIPDGVLSVGAGAMAECPTLEAVYFPASVAEIGEGCLDNCEGLKYILYDGTYTQWRELYDGIYRTGVELHTNDGTYYAQP